MEGNAIKSLLEKFKTRRSIVISAVALTVASIAAVSLWYAISGIGRRAEGAINVPPSDSSTSESTTSSDMVPRMLDGVLVASGTEALPRFAVMIDGHRDARPASGLSQANLVYSVPVEGGITRYLAVYDASTTADLIGPVRSARQYFVDLADSIDAVYAHVGGSPEALVSIRSLSGFKDLNEYFNGQYYWRSGKRSAPHNVYTRMDQLNKAYQAKGWNDGSLTSWMYKDEDISDGAASTTMRGTSSGPTLAYVNGYATAWTYDRDNNIYVRWQDGERQKDADSEQIVAKNVLVVSMRSVVVDDQGRLSMTTTGRGKAKLYHDGHVSDAVWRRKAGEHLTFESVDGADLLFNRGTTWVEIVSDPSVYSFVDTVTTP